MPENLSFDPLQIGARLLQYRNEMRLSQVQVAEQAGISIRTYADIERGETNMRTGTLIAICNVLNVTPNEVLVGSEAPIVEIEFQRAVTLFEDSNNRIKQALTILAQELHR